MPRPKPRHFYRKRLLVLDQNAEFSQLLVNFAHFCGLSRSRHIAAFDFDFRFIQSQLTDRVELGVVAFHEEALPIADAAQNADRMLGITNTAIA